MAALIRLRCSCSPLQAMPAPIIVNRAALTMSGTDMLGEIVTTKKPSTTLRPVAKSPGPNPPKPPATNTAGTNSR
jgi:hypothetical protein